MGELFFLHLPKMKQMIKAVSFIVCAAICATILDAMSVLHCTDSCPSFSLLFLWDSQWSVPSWCLHLFGAMPQLGTAALSMAASLSLCLIQGDLVKTTSKSWMNPFTASRHILSAHSHTKGELFSVLHLPHDRNLHLNWVQTKMIFMLKCAELSCKDKKKTYAQSVHMNTHTHTLRTSNENTYMDVMVLWQMHYQCILFSVCQSWM